MRPPVLPFAAVILLAPSAMAEPPARAPAPSVASAAPAPPASEPVEEPPYDPAQHFGYSEGAWLRATRGTERRSVGMMITGISLTSLGLALAIAGAAVAANGSHCGKSQVQLSDGSTTTLCGPMAGASSGMAVLSAGLIGIGIGLPLTVLGAAEVPRVEASGGSRAPSTPRAVVGLGLRGARFALTF